jgi:hypothetical protein
MEPFLAPWPKHTRVFGPTRSGKSKLLEHHAFNRAVYDLPFAVIDWHGTLYKSMVSMLCSLGKRALLINPSSDSSLGLPFFASYPAKEIAAERMLHNLLHIWGATNTNEAPTMERVARILFRKVAGGLPLHLASKQLEEGLPELGKLSAPEYRKTILSMQNRLDRLLSNPAAKRFLCTPPQINIRTEMEKGTFFLINLEKSDELDDITGRVFAVSFLSAFFDAAMSNASKPLDFTIYADEFVEYQPPNLASILDQSAKTGLRFCLAHQHMGHVEERLKHSLNSSCEPVLFTDRQQYEFRKQIHTVPPVWGYGQSDEKVAQFVQECQRKAGARTKEEADALLKPPSPDEGDTPKTNVRKPKPPEDDGPKKNTRKKK